MEIDLQIRLTIIEVYGDYTGYCTDFPHITATGTNKQMVVDKLIEKVYLMAVQDQQQYTFSLN